jgi:hypothetical protein
MRLHPFLRCTAVMGFDRRPLRWSEQGSISPVQCVRCRPHSRPVPASFHRLVVTQTDLLGSHNTRPAFLRDPDLLGLALMLQTVRSVNKKLAAPRLPACPARPPHGQRGRTASCRTAFAGAWGALHTNLPMIVAFRRHPPTYARAVGRAMRYRQSNGRLVIHRANRSASRSISTSSRLSRRRSDIAACCSRSSFSHL